MDAHTLMFSQCISNCAQELSHRSGGKAAAHANYRFMPEYPLVNVFWEGFKGTKTVENVFSDYWPSGPLLGTLVGFMEGGYTEQTIKDELRARAIMLLQNPEITNRDTLRVAHYVSLSSPKLNEQLKMIAAAHAGSLEGIHGRIYPLIFLFNDYSNNDASKGYRRLWESHAKLKDIPHRQEVALGPLLRDNTYLSRSVHLGEDQAEENYRIAADIAFLACTAPNAAGTPTGLSAWLENMGVALSMNGAVPGSEIVTASYLLMQKPSRRIAAVTLKALREERIRLAAERERKLCGEFAHENATAFFSQLGYDDGLPALDKAFGEYITLPDASCLEPIYQWKRVRKESTFAEANALTQGALQLFAERYFSVKTLGMLDADALAESISQEFMRKTDYLFAENYFESCTAFLSELRPLSGGGVYEELVNMARCDFYTLMLPKLKEALLRRAEEARAFRLFLEGFGEALSLPTERLEAGLESVDTFYANKALHLIDPDELISELYPCADEQAVFCAFEKAFHILIGKDLPVYRASLEDEIKQRTQFNPDGIAPNVIANFFGTDLSNKQRLPLMAVDELNTLGFYLIHANAKIGTNQQEHIQTVRTEILDRAERLQLYYADINGLMEGRSSL